MSTIHTEEKIPKRILSMLVAYSAIYGVRLARPLEQVNTVHI